MRLFKGDRDRISTVTTGAGQLGTLKPRMRIFDTVVTAVDATFTDIHSTVFGACILRYSPILRHPPIFHAAIRCAHIW